MGWRSGAYRRYVIDLLKRGDQLLFADVETTGLDSSCQIIQFSGIRYGYTKKPFCLEERERINLFIRPYDPLPKKIEELTGITDDFLKKYPYEDKVFPEIKAFLSRGGIPAGYNFGFDKRMIDSLFVRNHEISPIGDYIDILQMARDCIDADDIQDYKLGTVSSYMKADNGLRFHLAMDDVTATRRLFIAFLSKYLSYRQKEEKKERVVLSYLYFWRNPYQKSMARVDVVTSGGEFYYDTVKKCWGSKKDSKLSIEDTDMEDLEKQCLNKYGCADMDDLVILLKKRKGTQNKYDHS